MEEDLTRLHGTKRITYPPITSPMRPYVKTGKYRSGGNLVPDGTGIGIVPSHIAKNGKCIIISEEQIEELKKFQEMAIGMVLNNPEHDETFKAEGWQIMFGDLVVWNYDPINHNYAYHF